MSKQKLTVIVSETEMPLLYSEITKANNMSERLKVLAMIGLMYEKQFGEGFNIIQQKNVAFIKEDDKISETPKGNNPFDEGNDSFLLTMMGSV